MAPRRPTSTGRRKIEIRPIESEEARQVCFSKRRRGLFNKLSELSTMCGIGVAAVAFSPGGKAFSVGHPSVETVLDRFLPYTPPVGQDAAAMGGGPNPVLAELVRQQGELLRAQLDAEEAQKEAIKEGLAQARAEGCQAAALFHTAVIQMGEADLVAFEAALAKMEADVAAHSNQLIQDQEALFVGHMVHGGGGGGEFELGVGGTWASSGMEMMQQQQEMVMEATPPPTTGFAAGTQTPMQEQMAMMMMAMPPPPPTGFTAGMETMQQQQQMVAAMPPGFAAGMEMVPDQWFGPHGFLQ